MPLDAGAVRLRLETVQGPPPSTATPSRATTHGVGSDPGTSNTQLSARSFAGRRRRARFSAYGAADILGAQPRRKRRHTPKGRRLAWGHCPWHT